MKQSGNILFSGVGGQGILLASELTAHAQLAAGFDVKKSEVHGMAQRGGSVEAHLRYGEKIYSPLIEPGTAESHVAGCHVAARISGEQFPCGTEHLHLPHAVVRHVKISRIVQAHAVGLIVDLSGGIILLGQLGSTWRGPTLPGASAS